MAAALKFGIYPFQSVGTAEGTAQGAPDDFDRIGQAIMELSGGKTFLPRFYVLYTGPESVATVLKQVEMLVQIEIPWDLVLCYRDPNGELEGWTRLIRTIVDIFYRFGLLHDDYTPKPAFDAYRTLIAELG